MMNNINNFINKRKEIREKIWKELYKKGEALPPFPIRNRIPNFRGAKEAAWKLAKTEEWRKAQVVKINPDSPQRPLRELALEEGKIVIMPTPRLRSGFLILDPRGIPKTNYRRASTIRGAFKYGKILKNIYNIISKMPEIDLIVEGSVAIDRKCNRLGKGEGYGDIEYGILVELGKVSEKTPVATTISELQLVSEEIPVFEHDLPIDIVATPKRLIKCNQKRKPSGIVISELSREKIKEIPLLRQLVNKLVEDNEVHRATKRDQTSHC